MSTYQLGVKVSVDNSGVNEKLTSLQQGLAKTAGEAAKTGDTLDKKLKGGTNQAGIALTNFGRVIQDAPFGLIGIANNIDPLISSLQNLGKSSGGVGGAIKSLTASLIGPAGFAIGISVITSALIAFGPLLKESLGSGAVFQGLIKSAGDAAEAATKARQDFDLLIRQIDQFKAGSVSQSNAIDKVNSKLKEYGFEITNITEFQKNSGEVSAVFIKIKELEAKAMALAAEEAKAYARQIVLTQTLQSGNAFDVLGEVSALGLLRAALGEAGAVGKDYVEQIGKSVDKQKAFKASVNGINDEIFSLINSFKNIKGIGELTVAPKAIKIKPGKIELEFPKGKIFEELFTIDNGSAMSQMAESIRNAAKEAKKVADDFFTVNPAALKVKPVILPFKTNVSLVNEEFTKLTETLGAILQSTLQDAVYGLGETLGNMIADGGTLKNIFGSIFQVIGAGLKQMGKAMIAYGVGIDKLKKAIKNPTAAIIAGAGLVLLGSLMQKAIPQFAKGVNNFRGGMALVGERGPELVNLPTGSDVIPNDRIAGMMGGGMAIAVQDIVIDGNKLRIVLDRANQSFNRNF